jgi:uncharacterized protein (TIGR02145 family)
MSKTKHFLLGFLALWCGLSSLSAQVTIGVDVAPQDFSLLELVSTEKGLRLPQLTTVQRDALTLVINGSGANASLADGLVIQNITTNCFEYWNHSKWVSLCLGTANITLTDCAGAVYDPANPPYAEPSGGSAGSPPVADVICTYTPSDEPPCVVTSGQAYQVYLMAGSAYATLTVDELTSEFSVEFQPNNTANRRIAVVRVVNNCSGEFKDFIFYQNGSNCTAVSPFTLASYPSNNIICGNSGAVIAWVANPQANVEYVWEYSGVVVHTGVSMEITRPGVYNVYAEYLGCENAPHQTVTITKDVNTESSGAPQLTVTNGGSLCAGGSVIITAAGLIPGEQIRWFHNGVHYPAGNNLTTLTINQSALAGEWFVVQGSGTCGSRKSNTITVYDNTQSVPLPMPVATVNSVSLTNPTLTVCKGGTLELEITNHSAFPSGTFYEWFDDGTSIAYGTSSVIYTVAPSRDEMVLSVQATNNNGMCPQTVVSSKLTLSQTAPVATTINNGAATAAICGGTPAQLQATNSAGNEYEWFLNGVKITGVTTYSYSVLIPGTYSVRYRTGACWSPLSNAINVVQSASLNLLWLKEPADPTVVGTIGTYAVISVPTADSYVWTSSNPADAKITPLGGGVASIEFLQLTPNVTITVEAANECGNAVISKDLEIGLGCTPVTTVTLTPSGTVVKTLDPSGAAKTPGDAVTNFYASASGGTAPYEYEFYVNGSAVQGPSNTNTYSYTTPSTPGTHTVYVRAYNCGDPNTYIQSSTTTVLVEQELPTDVSGNYRLSGKSCYDVKQGNFDGTCMTADNRLNDFEDGLTFTYLFTKFGGQSYSDLAFYLDDPNNLIVSTSPAVGTPVAQADTVTFRITFRNDIRTVAALTDKNSAKTFNIIARYKNVAGTEVQTILPSKVQDCTCGCPVKNGGVNWLVYMCYNLGAEDWSIAQQKAYNTASPSDYSVYGYIYQWGRTSDGHEKRTSPNYHTNGRLGTTDVDANGQPLQGKGKGMFIPWGNYNQGANWNPSNTTTLWYNNGKTVNDPCPKGWRVPSSDEISRLSTYNPSTNQTAGRTYTNGNEQILYLPHSGNRSQSNGALANINSTGHYWSSTNSGGHAGIWNASSNSYYNEDKSDGFTIRCIINK